LTSVDFSRDVFQIVAARTADDDAVARTIAQFGRYFDAAAACQVVGRNGIRTEYFVEFSCCDDVTALASRLRTHIDDVVGCPHHIFVVFDDNDRVSRIAQLFQTAYQFPVVALVQSDGGFVQYI